MYYVLNPGMAAVLNAMIARCSTVNVMTSAQVTVVRRAPQGGFVIQCADGREVRVDDLVFTSSAPATLPLLRALPDAAAQQTALAAMEFRDAVLALHTDPIVCPGQSGIPVLLQCQGARELLRSVNVAEERAGCSGGENRCEGVEKLDHLCGTITGKRSGAGPV